MEKLEFRVRPVVRYVVTRYRHASTESGLPSLVETIGEFDNEAFADEVMKCMAEVQARWESHIRMETEARAEYASQTIHCGD
jgi:hypothetical protein